MDLERERKRIKYGLFLEYYSCATSALATYYYKYMYKEPCMTSLQRGENWMDEILNGHPIQCVNAFGMEPSLFMQLCEDLRSEYGLQPSKKSRL